FRYVACLLHYLRKENKINQLSRKTLINLPSNLEEIYSQAMKKLDLEYGSTLLVWLLYSFKPLHISQVAIILSIDLERLEANPYAELLVNLDQIIDNNLVVVNDDIVQLAHASVKTFLLDNYNNAQVKELFNISAQQAHKVIGQMCLVYLLKKDGYTNSRFSSKANNKPNFITFEQYAIQYWADHSQLNERAETPLKDTIGVTQTFLHKDSRYFKNWKLEYYYIAKRSAKGGHIFKDCSPLHVAAFFGLKDTMRTLLINKQTNVTSISNKDIDLRGESLGTAVQAAASGGFKDIIELLLNHGADVNIEGGYFGTALQVAAFCGHKDAVELLLMNNADVTAHRGLYGTALHAAVSERQKDIIQLLLKFKADINALGRHYGIALHAAVSEDHTDIIQLLLEHGADIRIQTRSHETALQIAVAKGYKDIIELLLKYGANVNAEGGYYGTALHTAVIKGHQDLVKLLLDNGANVNACHKYHGTALHKAVSMGDKNMIELLLEYEADINTQEYHETILQIAISKGYKDIIEFLLEYDANINA
ncbi:ankyrin repeat-containing domain protein, partial [Lentinula raphanica]